MFSQPSRPVSNRRKRTPGPHTVTREEFGGPTVQFPSIKSWKPTPPPREECQGQPAEPRTAGGLGEVAALRAQREAGRAGMTADRCPCKGMVAFLRAHVRRGHVTVAGGGDREGCPRPLCACFQTSGPGTPSPEAPSRRGSSRPQPHGLPGSLRAWRVSPPRPRPHPPQARSAHSAAATGRDRPLPVTLRGHQRRDDRLPRPGEETTRPTERGQSARSASWLSRHRRGPTPGTADRCRAPAAPHLTHPHRRGRSFFAGHTPARTHVVTYAHGGTQHARAKARRHAAKQLRGHALTYTRT